jgi:hypothetical protein
MEEMRMEGTFILLGAGTLVLLVAQLIEYIVESAGGPRTRISFRVLAEDPPPGDATPSAAITLCFDRAA